MFLPWQLILTAPLLIPLFLNFCSRLNLHTFISSYMFDFFLYVVIYLFPFYWMQVKVHIVIHALMIVERSNHGFQYIDSGSTVCTLFICSILNLQICTRVLWCHWIMPWFQLRNEKRGERKILILCLWIGAQLWDQPPPQDDKWKKKGKT